MYEEDIVCIYAITSFRDGGGEYAAGHKYSVDRDTAEVWEAEGMVTMPSDVTLEVHSGAIGQATLI